eukprot:765257-Hanusia_phi.AAC.1
MLVEDGNQHDEYQYYDEDVIHMLSSLNLALTTGFSRISFLTDASFLGTYYVCLENNRACVRFLSLPALPVTSCSFPLTDIDLSSVLFLFDKTTGLLCNLNNQQDLLTVVREPFTDISDRNNISAGASFPLAPLVQVKDLLGQPMERLSLQARVEMFDMSSWQQSTEIILRDEWSQKSNSSGLVAFSSDMGIDWLLNNTNSKNLFRLSFCLLADNHDLICISSKVTFSVFPGEIRFLNNPQPLLTVGSSLQNNVMVRIKLWSGTNTWTSGTQNWIPPFLQFALMADNANLTQTCFLDGNYITKALVGTQRAILPSVDVDLKDMKLSSCVAGSYRLHARAFSDVFSSFQNAFPSLSIDRSANSHVWFKNPLSNLDIPQHISSPLFASSQAVFAIKVISQPAERLATFRPFVISAKLFGGSSSIVNNFVMTCTIDENPTFPGVTYAAFDPGGRPGQFEPVRQLSSRTDENGVANFTIIFVRVDPARPLRLRLIMRLENKTRK